MALFQKSVLNKYLREIDDNRIAELYSSYGSYFLNLEIQQNIRDSKEEQFQEGFLRELFVNVLGYTINPNPNYNLTTELKNETGAKKADGAIMVGGKAIGVIELKSTSTKDLESIRQQAFDYKANQSECVYVVTSNFEKLRFYIDNAVDFEEFDLFTLSLEQFKLLYLCLHVDSIMAGIPKTAKIASLVKEENVTKKLYADYSFFKEKLFNSIISNDENIELAKKNDASTERLPRPSSPRRDISDKEAKLILFKKTQKLMDRFLFIFFAEDRGLIPPNTISTILGEWEQLKTLNVYVPLYTRFKNHFDYINTGWKGDNYEVFAYNGGLFLPDEILDNITISDEVLFEQTTILTKYDFDSEVDVNILGHIFEHSLNEIETMNAELEGQQIDLKKTKRKKDGVFYTPKYITKYIVDNTIGKLCEEKKQELSIVEDDYLRGKKGRKKDTVKQLETQLKDYRDWLLQITVVDPACGSGAFLNQALEFLIREHRWIDEMTAKLFGGGLVFQDVENSILENNLYGVDINEESVEIAKLSLWLRTAQKGRKLTSLNNNIKCGNSLIDDPEVAGDKAFKWEEEFSKVFAKGGFDVVIGNPPYGILIDTELQNYYSKHFPFTKYKINLYLLFIERMLQVLKKGIIHFIVPKSLLINSFYETMRRELINKVEINEVFTITEKVFEDAEVGGSLILKFTIKKNPNLKNLIRLTEAHKVENFINGFGLIENFVSQDFFLNIPNCEISVVSSNSQAVLEKLHSMKPIKDNYILKNGLNPGNIKHILITTKKENSLHKQIIWGKDIAKYNIIWSGDYVNYDEKISESLSLNDIKTKEGMNKQNRIDFALRTKDLFETKKIVIRKTGDSLISSIDNNNYYFDTLVHGIYQKDDSLKLEPLLAILNSRPATLFYRLLHDIKGKVFAKISLNNLGLFPFPDKKLILDAEQQLTSFVNELSLLISNLNSMTISFTNLLQSKYEIDKLSTKLQNWHELDFKQFIAELKKKKVVLSLSEEAEWMSYFNEKKAEAQELKAKIDATDNEIDLMVYKLYDLTYDEVLIVDPETSISREVYGE